MSKDLQNKLKRQWDTFNTSEQKIAANLLHYIRGILFETAACMDRCPRREASASFTDLFCVTDHLSEISG